MRHTVKAVYQDGVFRPTEKPEIQELQRVRLIVETEPAPDPSELLSLAAEVYEGLSESEIDEVEAIATERGDFFRRTA
jgi:predicted DNA-binding antitoxin AbrB/MazE fold protein